MYGRFSALLKEGYQRFRSPRTTVAIMSVLLGLYLLGLIIPQKALIPTADVYAQWKAGYPKLSAVIEYLHLNEIYLAPVTIFFLALFFTNLVVVMAHRVPRILRRMYLLQRSDDRQNSVLLRTAGIKAFAVPENISTVSEGIRSFLKKHAWTMVGGDGTVTFLAVKNRYSPIGFFFFHASFLLCLIGGLLVMYTRFAGTLVLTEGQQFTADLKQFHRIYKDPKAMRELKPVLFRLEHVVPRYEGTVGTDLDVDLSVIYDGQEKRERLKVNQPIERGAYSILPLDIGVSPLMVLRDRTGKEMTGSFFSLNVLKGGADSFTFTGIPYTFSVRFFPDFAETNGQPGSMSPEMKNPVMQLTIEKDGKVLSRNLLPLGQQAAFDDYVVAFDDVRYWVEFYVIREYGNVPLFAGFLFGIVGLVMRLIFFQKTLSISVQRDAAGVLIFLDGRSEYYPHSFRDELERIREALQHALSGRTAGDSVPTDTL